MGVKTIFKTIKIQLAVILAEHIENRQITTIPNGASSIRRVSRYGIFLF